MVDHIGYSPVRSKQAFGAYKPDMPSLEKVLGKNIANHDVANFKTSLMFHHMTFELERAGIDVVHIGTTRKQMKKGTSFWKSPVPEFDPLTYNPHQNNSYSFISFIDRKRGKVIPDKNCAAEPGIHSTNNFIDLVVEKGNEILTGLKK